MQMSDSEDEIPTLIESESSVISLPDAPPASERVPLTIICGFLGAGKSTLLKRILTERHGYRIAVIMNEFGDTADIEAKAINITSEGDPMAESSEEFLELANGCLCCSIKDAGVAAIEKLMQRKGAFDHILLETTGLADPGPIASMFWHNEEFAKGLGHDITLDGVICVVDAVFGKRQMEEDHSTDNLHIGESLRQIAGSDVILLNKVDIASPEAISLTETLIHQVNPAVPIYRTVRGEIDLKHILGISAYNNKLPKLNTTDDTYSTPHIHSEHCQHEHGNDPPKSTHYELRGISSLQVTCPILTDARYNRLDEWIRNVLWENRIPDGNAGPELQVLRSKGAFTLENGEHYVLQGVRSMYEMTKAESSDTLGIPDTGKIVLIGKGLNEAVRSSLEKVFI
ncbi:CobW/HypB/UreG, nucleotide-binding domain-containing protein [Cyathus striatus]|nr:CobW/HypB/UreG, nucleotide-binding domain-containing protein [Cyathus striatus]